MKLVFIDHVNFMDKDQMCLLIHFLFVNLYSRINIYMSVFTVKQANEDFHVSGFISKKEVLPLS